VRQFRTDCDFEVPMPLQCPTCSKVNPADAVYCYYDGRSLKAGGPEGPVGLGTSPFPLPFCFADGQSCANFNQLALACDERWGEARRLLAEGIWHAYFASIGRLDLAAAARQAAAEPDLDVGLSHLLEQLPVAGDTLRPPKLAVPSAEEDLGTLEPGKDHKFELRITNQGMLVLRGMVTTECDWLSFGERAGGPSLKMFQTRNVFTLPVRVLGGQVRAGQKPLEGQIVIDTNGGLITLPVRADVPIRPFPKGQYANDVLAGARSPRELAVKAKAHLKEAAVLFEQGAVKVWYLSNGWTYPVQGSAGTGKGAVQQFFEALGLTKAPRLEIDTERIVCRGRPGQGLTRHVTVSTKEPRFVYAQAWSTQDWVQPGPARAQGNTAIIPLHIQVPPRPGEKLQADVRVEGNGKQQFVVPVTLAVAAARPAADEEPEETRRRLPLGWVLAAAGLLLAAVVGVGALALGSRDEPAENPPVVVVNNRPPAPKDGAWWDGSADSNLAALAAALKESAPAEVALIDGISARSDVERYKAYEQFQAKLPELLRDPKVREPLRGFVTACCVYEPSDLNVSPLRRAVARQWPRDGVAFRPEEKGGELERALFSLRVTFDAMSHKATRPARARSLANDLGNAFLSLDTSAPPEKLKAQTEKALAERCYRNLLPTAAKSAEFALAVRAAVLEKFPQHLARPLRDNVDVGLVTAGLSQGAGAWPRLAPILKTCLESDERSIGWRIAGLYEQAGPDLARMMEEVLAARWKAVANPKLQHADKVAAIRKRLVTPKISPAQRLAQLQKLTRGTLAAVKAGEKKETALLQDTTRLAHASTMACTLLHQDAEGERFDELIAKVPTIQQADEQTAKADDSKRPDKKAGRPDVKGAIVVGPQVKVISGQLTRFGARDPGRRGHFCNVYRVFMRGGLVYTIDMKSRAFDSYLRLEDPGGLGLMEDDDGGGYPDARIIFPAPADGVYRVITTTFANGATGPYTLYIHEGGGFAGPAFGVPRLGFPHLPPPRRPFGPVVVPGVPAQPVQEEQPAPEKKEKQVSESDLADLRSPQSNVRVAAFGNLAANVTDDLAPRHARIIAEYLLLKVEQKSELEEVTGKLESFARCRHLALALADCVAGENATQQTAESVIGGVLGQPLRFARDEDWRSACRKMLLQRALDLTGTTMSGADQAAVVLRDLYREQGLALGLDDPEFLGLTGPTRVLERVIRHVAARAGKGSPTAEDRAYLGQLDRHLRAARFVAENDLEHLVLLQRHWLKVLTIYLRGRVPAQADGMLAVQQVLAVRDGRSRSVLEQLRAGEESALRVWALAHDLK
jgi:hypothetical protein